MPSDPNPSQVDGAQQELIERLHALETRVAFLESRVGHEPAASQEPVAAAPAPLEAAAERAARAGALRRLVHAGLEEGRATHAEQPVAPPLAPPVQAGFTAGAKKETSPGPSMEQLVGGRWYAVLGALAVTIGVGLFVKFAYDQGWLRVQPVWRCVGGAGFGVALIVCAEWVRRRFGAWAAFGSYSAGLGAVYVSVYLAYRLYGLLPAPATFVLLGVVAVGGLAVSVRAGLQAVGVVSLLGGYLAPFLLFDAPSKPLALPAYLLMLQVVGMGLVAWRRGEFAVVRQVVTWMTMGMGLFWVLRDGDRALWWAQAYLLASWCVTHAELVCTAVRADGRDDGRPWAGLSMVSSIAVTGWWVGLGCAHAHRLGLLPVWLVPLAACAATVALGMFVSGSGLIVDRVASSRREALGQSLCALGGAMLALTVALALRGPGEVVAWLVLGTAAGVIGWRLCALSVRVYACLLLGVGTARLLVFDSWSGMHRGGLLLGGAALTQWTLMMALAGLAWLTMTQTRRREGTRGAVDSGLTAAALLPVFAGFVHPHVGPGMLAWAWCVLVALVGALRGTSRMPLDRAAGLLAALPCVAWAVRLADAAVSGGTLPYDAPTSVQGLVVGAVGLGTAAWVRFWSVRDERPVFAAPPALAGAVMTFAASSLGVAAVVTSVTDDLLARRAAISLWWGVVAVGVLVAGFVRSAPVVRHVGLALLGVAAVKVVTFDLVEVSPGWRIASFLVLGLMMLGVAFGYGRVHATLKARGGGPG